MKKLLLVVGGIISSMVINAQVIGYDQAGLLFSSDDNNGTARFNAMSGAFGALGGDMSAVDINPAGLAVFKNTQFSGTLGFNSIKVLNDFYGTSSGITNNTTDLTQIGGVLVLNRNARSNSQKVAIGFNYTTSKDFENFWIAEGTSGFTPITDFYDPDVLYPNIDGQRFSNFTDGSNKRFSLTIASQPSDKLYVGASLVTYDLDYYQSTISEEFNSDDDGNTFDILAEEELFTFGSGVSFNVGLIAKPSQEIRLGLAYQSPTWYQLSEEQVIYDDELFFNDVDDVGGIVANNVFDYDLVSPSKLTGSFAYIIGKEGLISLDYSYKDYSAIKLKPSGEFINENQDFAINLKGSSQIKIGGEWRVDNLSLRGGYFYEESPYQDALDTDHITGYSLGIGFKFGDRSRFDLAYQNRKNTDFYNFLNIDGADPVELDINKDKITATFVFGF